MKWLAFSVICLLFLVACADEELPPTPPPPGGEAAAGRATANILSLDPKVLPKWALPLEKNVEVSFTDKEIVVKVKRPADAHKDARVLVLTRSYFFGIQQYTAWVENRAIPGSSGKLAADLWNVDYAEYRALLSLFKPGQNFFVIFYCYEDIDGKTGKPKRDSKGYIVWKACNKYRLAGFEIGGSYKELIEKQIENELYKGSAKADTSIGTAYTAKYEDRYNGDETTVTVTKLNNVEDYKKTQALDVAKLEPMWTKNGNVCGFEKKEAEQTSFWWISGSWLVKVVTFADAIASDKVGNYGIKYASDCSLFDKLKDIAKGGANVCGNGKAESGEQCDNADDSVCPNACKPDCTCGWIGLPNAGVCGDYIIQKPNSLNVIEQCELPGKRDSITGQLVASSCFVRDNAGKITGVGACDDKCQCDPNIKVSTPLCNNGRADPGEQCGDPGTGLCKANEVCKNCGCIPIPQNCVHNGKIDANEKCDPTANPTGCALSEVCSPTCVCAKAMAKCGNGQADFGEQCGEPGLSCPVIPGLFGACIGCNCWYFFPPWPPFGGCGNGFKEAGEECEADIDCANPPGGTASPLCNKATCKCNRICGDARVDSPNDEAPPKNEKCDPPGSKCTLPDGSIGVCDNNCGCVVGCGDGVINAPEECDPPGSLCLCAIGPGGFISCKVCIDCKCQGSEVKAKGDCPGVNCGEPNGYIKLNTLSYSGYGFGEHLTKYDTGWPMGPDTLIGSQCWTGPCAGTVAVDGAAAGQDGTCYQGTQGSEIVVTNYITSYPKHCEGNYIVSYSTSTTTPKTCIESRSICPPNMKCQQVTSPPSAACITSTASPSPGPSPLPESRAWVSSDITCGGNVPCPSPCPTPVTTGYACSASGSTCEKSGTVLTCMSGPDTYAGHAFSNVATGLTFRTADVTNSSGVQIALFIIASLAILLVTLLNFVHTDK